MTNTRIAQLLLEEGWNLHVNDDPAVPPVLLKMTQHDELLACPIEHDAVIDLYHQGLIVKHATIGSVVVYRSAPVQTDKRSEMRAFAIGVAFTCLVLMIIGFTIARFF